MEAEEESLWFTEFDDFVFAPSQNTWRNAWKGKQVYEAGHFGGREGREERNGCDI